MNCCGGVGTDGKEGGVQGCGGHCGRHMGKMVIMIMVGLALTGWLFVDAGYKNAQKKQVGVLPLERHTLTVSADDKVTISPDIAMLSVGLSIDGFKIAESQKVNTQRFNDLLGRLKALGIDEKDLKTTSYGIQPKYNWTNNAQVFMGYTVSQDLEIKIRDLSKAGDVLQAAGSIGANRVGNLEFSVEFPDKYVDQARALAVEKAKTKAQTMASQAGFKLGKVVNYSEGGYNPTPYPMYYDKMMLGAAPSAAPAPTIQPGTQDISSSVTLTYEIE